MKIVQPHRKKGRLATDADISKILSDAKNMQIFFQRKDCIALSHTQVDESDPLAFFLLADGQIVVNPEIIQHSNYTVDSKEACLTFPEREGIIHQRWQKIVVACQFIKDEKLTERQNLDKSGKQSFIFQHECDHLNGRYCYD